MNKKIFVIGCSYRHHDVYVEPNETWPSLLQENTGYTIINCSLPGSSNFSYFYRLQEIEKEYGKPDKVIVQLTSLHRLFMHLKNEPIHNIIQDYPDREYYYDLYKPFHDMGYFVVPQTMFEYRKLKILNEKYNMKPKYLKWIWKYFATDANLEWMLYKETKLIDLYYDDVTFFSWNYKYKLDVKKYLGSLKYELLKDKFDDCSYIPKKDDHFGIEGHKILSEIIQEHV